MNQSNIWIGGLPIGRDWDEQETIYNLSLLPNNKKVIIDIADIYSQGNAFKIIQNLQNELPSNIYLSLKFGLKIDYKNNRFGVSKKKIEKLEIYTKISSFLENFNSNKIFSIQLHCMPPDKESILNFQDSFLKIQNQIPKLKLGISNVEIDEAKKLINFFETPINSIQIQANLLEQRLIREYENKFFKNYDLLINRSLCRGLIRSPKKFLENKNSRFNNSIRVKESLSKQRLDFLYFLDNQSKKMHSSIELIAYAWLLSFGNNIFPIIGARNSKQLSHSIDLLQNINEEDLKLSNYFGDLANRNFELNALNLPLCALDL